jgi:hypothetical protein
LSDFQTTQQILEILKSRNRVFSKSIETMPGFMPLMHGQAILATRLCGPESAEEDGGMSSFARMCGLQRALVAADFQRAAVMLDARVPSLRAAACDLEH